MINDYIAQVVNDEFWSLDQKEHKAFFQRYQFFSTNDFSRLLGRSTRWVRKCKAAAGLGRAVNHAPPPPNRSIPKVIDIPPPTPEQLEDPAWWNSVYPKYSIYALSKLSGKYTDYIWRRVRKYCGKTVPLREALRSKHPCCNREWLIENYVNKKLNSEECGALAGVSQDTIKSWLNIHHIDIRQSAFASSLGKVHSVEAVPAADSNRS